MEGRDVLGPGPGITGNMQVSYAGGGMSNPQNVSMGGGLGQGLSTPPITRPPLPSQGMAAGIGNLAPDGGHVDPHLTISMPMGTSTGMALGSMAGLEQPLKKKKGRPRKYIAGDSTPGVRGASPSSALAMPMPSSSSPHPSPVEKRGRGRPPGSGKKQLAALGVVLSGSGQGFTPHILTVNTGEDVSTKIMQFAQNGPRAMCVLSANGVVSNAILRQQSSSGGTVTYEGRYEILSLSGSYLPTDTRSGGRQRTGGLSVSLAGSNGQVFGGGVAGMLTAASPVQVVVGSFLSDAFKSQPKPELLVGVAQGGTSGAAANPGIQHPPASESGLEGTSVAGSQQEPSWSAQTSGQAPQATGMFQSLGAWASPHVVGDSWRIPSNFSLPGTCAKYFMEVINVVLKDAPAFCSRAKRHSSTK